MGVHLERGKLLYSQSRLDLAEAELRKELASNPQDSEAHGLLALCLIEKGDRARATEEAKLAIEASPDDPYPHFVMAKVLLDRDRPEEAIRAVGEAIRLDPEAAHYHGLLAAIRLGQEKWQEGLRAAEKGLEVDPESTQCANLRAMALVQLGRRKEAAATIEGALQQDPESALTHANQGWALLESGDSRKALEHFREALRIDAELDWARQGIVEALKARNVIYALFLRYVFWMLKLSPTTRWVLIIGAVFAARLLRGLARAYPALAPVVWPLLIAYWLFVVLTWIGYPVFNLLLRLDRFGRHALSPEQLRATNWVGATMLAAAVLLVAILVAGKEEALLAVAGFGLLVLPVSGTFKCAEGWPRRTMAACTAVLAAAGLTALWIHFVSPADDAVAMATARAFSNLIFVGALLSTWLAAALGEVRPKR